MISSSRSFQTLRADHDDRARAVAGADEDVLRHRRAVDEIPRLQAPFLALDHEHALAGDDEEVLLRPLAVVHAGRLARLSTTSWKPSSSNSASPSRFAHRPWPSRPRHVTSRALTTNAASSLTAAIPPGTPTAPPAGSARKPRPASRLLEHARVVLRRHLVHRHRRSRSRPLGCPTMTITHGPSPAPTKMCSVHGGQWTKSHCLQAPLLALEDE